MSRVFDIVDRSAAFVRAVGFDDAAVLGDAALPIVEGARSASTSLPTFDVGVIGGGPGGAMAALAAARKGASAIVLEGRAETGGANAWGTRNRLAMLDTLALERHGLRDTLEGAYFQSADRRYGLAQFGEIEHHLRARSEELGVTWRFDSAPSAAEIRPDGGFVVSLPTDSIRVRTLLDFSGGRSGIADAHGIGLLPPLPGVTYGFIGAYGLQDPATTGLQYGTSVIRASDSQPHSISVLNHPLHGAHVDIAIPDPEFVASHADPATLHAQLARRAGVVDDLRSAPFVLAMVQQRATAARAGDLLIGGDSMARVDPGRFPGLQGAMRDAVLAGEAAATTGEGREDALRRAAHGIERRAGSDLFFGLQAHPEYHDLGLTEQSMIAARGYVRAAAGGRT